MSGDNFDDEFDGSLPSDSCHPMARRFHGYLSVVVDAETDGLNSATDALPEIVTTAAGMDGKGFLLPEHTYFFRIEPFESTNIESAALKLAGIKLGHPLRTVVQEEAVFIRTFRDTRKALKTNGCRRTILVGHNSSFGLGLLNATVVRTGIKCNLFHPSSSSGTATLADLVYSQTVLARVYQAADMGFDNRGVYSARYGTEKTAGPFCGIVNRWRETGSWMDDDN